MTDRAAICSAARSLVSLTYPTAAYLSLVAPFESTAGETQRADEIGRMSGCALVWMGLARLVWGMRAERYATGSAFAVLYRYVGPALRVPALDAPPQPGDALVWGASGSAVAHVDACVIEVVGEAGALTVTVVAGGQRDASGNECVKVIQRALRWQGGRWVDTGDGRTLVGVVDADAMGERYAAG